jgi:DNA glycosylase AlkZ-like
VGLQAQVPNTPYLGLWTRLEGFRVEELVRLVVSRRAVRATLMRGTLHLVTARDYKALRPLFQPMLLRVMRGGYRRQLAGANLTRIAEAGRALLEGEPRTGAEVAALLQKRWPGRDARALSYVVQCGVPLVQVTPRGIWERTGPPAWLTAEAWLGRDWGTPARLERLIERYLDAFGPATLSDMRAWSGLPAIREIVERVRPRLVVFRDESGRELFDRPRAPRPHPDTSAPPRFLPFYDNALLAHADRGRIVPAGRGQWGFQNQGLLVGTVLLDGFLNGGWRIAIERERAVLTVEPFARLATRDEDALVGEAEGLVAFAAAEATSRDVRIVRPRGIAVSSGRR